jgi:hypothetical protein
MGHDESEAYAVIDVVVVVGDLVGDVGDRRFERGHAALEEPPPDVADCGGAGDLGNLERVRESRTEPVALVIDQHLGLVLEAPERGAVDDPIAVALKLAAEARRRLGVTAPRELPSDAA